MGSDARRHLEIQDIQIENVKVHDGDVVLLRFEALVRNRSAVPWSGRGARAIVQENGGNRLVKPGGVGAVLVSPVGPGETGRLSFVVDGRGVAKDFRISQEGPDSYEAFHRHVVNVGRD